MPDFSMTPKLIPLNADFVLEIQETMVLMLEKAKQLRSVPILRAGRTVQEVVPAFLRAPHKPPSSQNLTISLYVSARLRFRFVEYV